MASASVRELHVVSHTHWDREWYYPFEQFRFRLVRLVDGLLDILATDPDYRHFHLDGQTILLQDYLEIKPEAEAVLRDHVRSGRVLIGPWYVLPDELLVSGESLIRNLLLGRAVGERLGPVMSIGYLPDSFGHPSQMPQILRGFGIDNAIFWRGLSGADVPSELEWRAPDGSAVLAIHLPDEYGYTSLQYWESDVERAYENVQRKRRALVAHATTPYLLLMNGMDHMEPQPDVPRLIAAVNERLATEGDGARLIHSTLPDYVALVRQALNNPSAVTGELRDTNRNPAARYNFVLAGVLSTRMYLKQQNRAAETLLERWAEPLAVLASVVAEQQYPRGFLAYAWKLLLQNHPHDSICGCSVDAVHREMVTRFARVEQLGEEIVGRSLGAIAERVDTTILEEGEVALVAFNSLPWRRDEVVHVEVMTESRGVADRSVRVLDAFGVPVPAKLLGFRDAPELPPWGQYGKRLAQLCFAARDLPPGGYAVFRCRLLPRPERQPTPLLTGRDWMENARLRVSISADGTISLTDKRGGTTYDGLNLLEDGGDVGDEYTYSHPTADRVIFSTGAAKTIALVDDGPARATFLIEYDLLLPEAALSDQTGRSDATVPNRVRSYVTLGADAERVEMTTEIENRSRDHRLRVLFPTGGVALVSHAESTFDVVTRPVEVLQPEEWIEDAPTLHQQGTFVDVGDGGRGLTIANRGLPEYELKPDGTLALTLLRAVGHLARPSNTINWHAGPRLPTPEAQCLGWHTFHYAVVPHGSDWLAGGTDRQAHAHAAPVRAVVTGRHAGPLPRERSFLALEGEGLMLSAIKRAEASDAIVVRLHNPTEREVSGRLRVALPVARARFARLDEQPEGAAPLATGPSAVGRDDLTGGDPATIDLTVPPKTIVTLLLDLAPGPATRA